MLEKLKKVFKAPETPAETMRREMSERHEATRKEMQKNEVARMEMMEKRREEAERASIEQAQSDIKQLPEDINSLDFKIKAFQASATRNNGRAQSVQPHLHGAEQGSHQQEELLRAQRDLQNLSDLDTRNAELLAQEKSRLETKLYAAKKLLEVRGLLEK